MSLRWICRHAGCELYGQEQKGDHESVYFAVLCVRCMRPVHSENSVRDREGFIRG